MRRTPGPLIEALESRRLLASATIIADMGAISAAENRLKVEQADCRTLLAADQGKIRADAGQRGNGGPLLAKLKADTLDCRGQLIADRTNIKTIRVTTRAAVVRDLGQIRADKGNASALASDRIKLATDRAKQINDPKIATQTLQTDDRACRNLIAADRLAIVNFRKGIGPAVAADRLQLVADKGGCAQTLATDKQAIIAARLKLAEDRRAGL